jgi:hypothetical protein
VICALQQPGSERCGPIGQAREHVVATGFSQPMFEYLLFRIDDESSFARRPVSSHA